MNYRVRIADRVVRYFGCGTVRSVIRAIRREYSRPREHEFVISPIDIFEDTPECRLAASKKSGNLNFSWRKR